MASVFMVYLGSWLRGLVSMMQGSLAMLGGMSPMLVGLLVRLRLVSSLIRLAGGRVGFAYGLSVCLCRLLGQAQFRLGSWSCGLVK